MILFKFSPDILTTLFSNVRAEYKNTDDRTDLIYTDDSLCSEDEMRLMCMKDVGNLHEGGQWEYDCYVVDPCKYIDRPMSAMVENETPLMTMQGYFGKLSDNVIHEDAHEKPVVVAIVGESGSGKTVLSLELERLGIPNIVSYTTRLMRVGETDGREHWFVTEDKMPDKSDMLAYTYFGGNHYWTDKRDLADKKLITYVIDEQGVLDLYELKKAGEIDVIYVYVRREDNPTDEERKNRDACRTEAQEKMKQLGIEPHIVVVNDYPDAESFLKKDGDDLSRCLWFMCGDMCKLEEK